MSHLLNVDFVLLVIAAVSVLVGWVRGFLFEVLSLVGWVAAYWAAHWFSPDMTHWVSQGETRSAVNEGVTFAGIFIGVLIVWGLLARLLSMVIHATPLKIIDRVFGAVFGAGRALIVMMAMTTMVMLTSFAQSEAWQQSHGAGWLMSVFSYIKPVLPSQIVQHLLQ